MSEWISVKDRLPRESNQYLISHKECIYIAHYINTADRWIMGYHNISIYPTHWMPLPEPPQEDEG